MCSMNALDRFFLTVNINSMTVSEAMTEVPKKAQGRGILSRIGGNGM